MSTSSINENGFTDLFGRYTSQLATAQEKQELMALIESGEYDVLLRELVGEKWLDVIPDRIRDNDKARAEEVYRKILERVKVKVLIPWRRYVAVAAAVLLLMMGGYWLFTGKKSGNEAKPAIAQTQDLKAPASSKAVITLANGKQIVLDSAGNGTLATQGNVQLVKLADGQIAYNEATTQHGGEEVSYNTLSNPRGSRVISLTLSDGTKVWLNAASSLTYPTAFTGVERKVSITGEAYFEVTHHATQPFIVSKNNMEVRVLGTHFNVNAYDDEPGIKVTLLEGRVKVSLRQARGAGSVTIQPGQQAVSGNNGQLTVNHTADMDQVMAWKNGNFYFNHTDLQTVMRQISRWYDVDVSYEGQLPEMYFGGDVSRDNSASEVLKILAESNVHFRIEGRKIIVTK